MTRIFRGAPVLALLLGCAFPVIAQEVPLTPPETYAPAATRNDAFPNAYEVLPVPELGSVFVASVPGLEDDDSGDVYMLDADNLAVQRRIQLQRRPFALAMDHRRGWIYAGNTKDGALSVIDAKSGLFLRRIQLGSVVNGKMEHTRMIEVDEETGRVYVTGPTDRGILWIIDGPAGKVIERVDDAGLWAAGLARDGDRLYIGSGGAEEIWVRDAKTGALITTYSTGDTPPGSGDKSAHFMVNLSIDTAGGRLFAVDSHGGALYVFDTKTGKIITQVPIGMGALDVVYNPVRDEAYVTWSGYTQSNMGGVGGIAVVDTKNYTVTRRLAVESFPNSLALDAEKQVLFASVREPSRPGHPNYRKNQLDAVFRLDLKALNTLP